MGNRSDAGADFGRTGVPEAGADARLHGLFAVIDGAVPAVTTGPDGLPVQVRRRPEPVRAGPDGELIGELELADRVMFLPEQHPDDVEAKRDRITSLIPTLVVGVLVILGASQMDDLMRVDAGGLLGSLPGFGVMLVAVGLISLMLIRALVFDPGRPPRTGWSGTPGVFLLRDALIVRRGGLCDVFPRQAVVAIEEAMHTRADEIGKPPVRYPVTEIKYQGLRGRCTYTLDVGTSAWAADAVRVGRLRRLQRWLKE